MNFLRALFFCSAALPMLCFGTATPATQGERYVKELQATVQGTPGQIFPLLCPVREYEWIPSWSCDLIYSKSGVVENNCIFVTHYPGEDPTVWVTTLYDPAGNRVEFVRFVPGRKVVKMDIQVADAGNGQSRVFVRYTHTGLTKEGNEEVAREIARNGKTYDDTFHGLMDLLNGYLAKHAK